jgi:CBS domain containing-hemolysin-like protein
MHFHGVLRVFRIFFTFLLQVILFVILSHYYAFYIMGYIHWICNYCLNVFLDVFQNSQKEKLEPNLSNILFKCVSFGTTVNEKLSKQEMNQGHN